MNKRVLISAVLAAIIVPGAMAFGQQSTQPAAASQAPVTAAPDASVCVQTSPIASAEVIASNFVAQVAAFQPEQLGNNNNTPQSLSAVINAGLVGHGGATPIEGLRTLDSFFQTVGLNVKVDNSNGSNLIADARKRVGEVLSAFDGFIEERQKGPKKDKNYDKNIEAAALKVKNAIVASLDPKNNLLSKDVEEIVEMDSAN